MSRGQNRDSPYFLLCGGVFYLSSHVKENRSIISSSCISAVMGLELLLLTLSIWAFGIPQTSVERCSLHVWSKVFLSVGLRYNQVPKMNIFFFFLPQQGFWPDFLHRDECLHQTDRLLPQHGHAALPYTDIKSFPHSTNWVWAAGSSWPNFTLPGKCTKLTFVLFTWCISLHYVKHIRNLCCRYSWLVVFAVVPF